MLALNKIGRIYQKIILFISSCTSPGNNKEV